MTDRKKYMMDEARHVLSLLPVCVTQTFEESCTLKIVDYVPLFYLARLLATDQFGPYTLKADLFLLCLSLRNIPKSGRRRALCVGALQRRVIGSQGSWWPPNPAGMICHPQPITPVTDRLAGTG